MTIEVPETRASSAGEPERRSRLTWLIAVVVVVVMVGALVAGVVASRGEDSTSIDGAAGAQQLASVQQSCTAWHDGYAGSVAPSATWCNDMVGWMADQLRSRHMEASMMWSDPDRMVATCQRWISSTPRSGSTPDASAWCGQMVGWMTHHGGPWDRGWMMNSPTMGG